MHLTNFIKVCDTVKYNGVTEEALRLRLFLLSLGDRAKHWLTSQPPNSITPWNDLLQKFLTKFFPPGKIAQLVQEINTFGQLEGESLVEAWDRFHELLRKFPHHMLTRWMQVHTFYNGLRNATRTVIDASAGGALMKKITDQAYEILEDAATNTNQWPKDRITLVKAMAAQITRFSVIWLLMSHSLLNSLLGNKVPRMPFRPAHGSYVNSVEDSTTVQNVSQDNKQESMPSMCRGLISHNNRVSMGATTIKTRIKAKVGIIIRTTRAIRVMDGGTIKATCHHPSE